MLGIIIGSTLDIFFLSGWMCSLSRGAIHDACVYNDGAMMLWMLAGRGKSIRTRRLTLSNPVNQNRSALLLWWLCLSYEAMETRQQRMMRVLHNAND